MIIEQLVSAVNAARAREDFIFYKFSQEKPEANLNPSSTISFLFDGRVFRTNLPYRIRLTKGVVLDELNKYCYLVEGIKFYKVTFKVDSSGNVSWSI